MSGGREGGEDGGAVAVGEEVVQRRQAAQGRAAHNDTARPTQRAMVRREVRDLEARAEKEIGSLNGWEGRVRRRDQKWRLRRGVAVAAGGTAGQRRMVENRVSVRVALRGGTDGGVCAIEFILT